MRDSDKITKIHRDIMRRCYDSRNRLYPAYGERGIHVCEEWHDKEMFTDWIRSKGFFGGVRIKRYDSKSDFSPENCYLVPSKELASLMTQEEFDLRIEMYKSKYAYMKKYNLINNHNHPLYFTHAGMINRCYNENSSEYKHYGGRGISVCDEWRGMLGFYHFLDWVEDDGGYRKGLSLDRIDCNGDYEPQNCRWATDQVQGRNKRNIHQFLVNGELHSAMSYCKMFGYPYGKFLKMLNDGVPISKILDALG